MMSSDYTLYHDDCLTVLKTLPDKSIDLVVTSPPYNMQTRIRGDGYSKREKANNFSRKYEEFSDDMSIDDYYDFHSSVMRELFRVSSLIAYNIQVVTGSKESLFKMIGDFHKEIKDIIIWDKGYGQPAMHPVVLNRATEFIIMLDPEARAGRAFSQFSFERGTLSDIWRIPRERSVDTGHHAIFPLELADQLIVNFSTVGHTIFDPFMGTGTTGVSAIMNKRKFIGVELQEKYFTTATDRIGSAAAKSDIFHSLFTEEGN